MILCGNKSWTTRSDLRINAVRIESLAGNVFPRLMLAVRDNLAECFSALRAHKLRASLTTLGLTMGVATLITVMTLVRGANVYVGDSRQLTHERGSPRF